MKSNIKQFKSKPDIEKEEVSKNIQDTLAEYNISVMDHLKNGSEPKIIAITLNELDDESEMITFISNNVTGKDLAIISLELGHKLMTELV
jgi:hypothetical protein